VDSLASIENPSRHSAGSPQVLKFALHLVTTRPSDQAHSLRPHRVLPTHPRTLPWTVIQSQEIDRKYAARASKVGVVEASHDIPRVCIMTLSVQNVCFHNAPLRGPSHSSDDTGSKSMNHATSTLLLSEYEDGSQEGAAKTVNVTCTGP
jgi:hypothetical protein